MPIWTQSGKPWKCCWRSQGFWTLGWTWSLSRYVWDSVNKASTRRPCLQSSRSWGNPQRLLRPLRAAQTEDETGAPQCFEKALWEHAPSLGSMPTMNSTASFGTWLSLPCQWLMCCALTCVWIFMLRPQPESSPWSTNLPLKQDLAQPCCFKSRCSVSFFVYFLLFFSDIICHL